MKIRDACVNAGNPEPIYHIKKDELTVVFKAKELLDHPKESFDDPKESFDDPKESFDDPKELFDGPKELFDSRKEAFERAICDLNGYQSSKENLLKTFNLLCDAEFFGRQEIAKLCDINSTNAGKMIDKLKACNSIEPVKGHGKGKYHFII